jgi:hypothetical protein
LPGAIAERVGWPLIARLPWTHNRFEVAQSLTKLRIPVLFIVSRQDGLVPYADSRRAARYAHLCRWLEVDGLQHDGLLAAVAQDGRLSHALASLVPKGVIPAVARRAESRDRPERQRVRRSRISRYAAFKDDVEHSWARN